MANGISRRGFFRTGVALAAVPALGLGKTAQAGKAGDLLRLQESKEFQLKLRLAEGQRKLEVGQADEQLYEAARSALIQAGEALAGRGNARLSSSGKPFAREAIRFDTAPGSDGLFRSRWLSLAIEASDKRTKLKCKQHSLVAELIVSAPEDSVCYPRPGKGADAKAKPVIKVEQDLHLNNVKTCVSGSLYLKGRQTRISQVGFFSEHFPALETIAPAATALQVVHHWRESVHDDMLLEVGDASFRLMLVTRRDFASGMPIESELAYKLIKPDSGWDRGRLQLACGLYRELRATGLFEPDPPIFYFLDPVSSVDIRRL